MNNEITVEELSVIPKESYMLIDIDPTLSDEPEFPELTEYPERHITIAKQTALT